MNHPNFGLQKKINLWVNFQNWIGMLRSRNESLEQFVIFNDEYIYFTIPKIMVPAFTFTPMLTS